MLIDTHTHLDAAEFDADRDAVIGAARAAGVRTMIVLAIDAANFATVRELARSRPGIVYALGIHPIYVERSRDEDLAVLRKEIEASLDDPRFVAIGEIGLDHFVPGLDHERQLRFYIAQLEMAREFELPALLHIRRAQDAILKQLRRLRPPGGIAHAFNGSEQQAGQFVELGFALGFGGAMTWPRALRIRRLAATMPGEALVLETDSPDIPPVWLGDRRNAPVELPRIACELAALRQLAPDAIAELTTANVLRILPRLAGML
ncbi:MAG TPA: TatD family hydrolase [Burkholderiaceae bacterium]|nr:TatD family hydrolase [Burkholderiaceae bacterium]